MPDTFVVDVAGLNSQLDAAAAARDPAALVAATPAGASAVRYELGPPQRRPRAAEGSDCDVDDEDGNVESVGDDDDDEFGVNNGNSSTASAQEVGAGGDALPPPEKENEEDFFIGASGTTKSKTRSALAAAAGGRGNDADEKSAFAGFDGARGGRVGGRSPGPLAASVSRLSM